MGKNIRSYGYRSIIDAPTEYVQSDEMTAIFREADRLDDQMMAPAIALYMEGKDVLHCPSYAAEEQRQFRSLCRRSQRIFVVGARSVGDPHLWDPIASSRAELYYFNPSKTDCDQFAADMDKRGRSYQIHRDTFEGLLQHLGHG